MHGYSHVTRHITEPLGVPALAARMWKEEWVVTPGHRRWQLKKETELATWTWGYFSPLGSTLWPIEFHQTFRMPELTSDSSVTPRKITNSFIHKMTVCKYEVFGKS